MRVAADKSTSIKPKPARRRKAAPEKKRARDGRNDPPPPPPPQRVDLTEVQDGVRVKVVAVYNYKGGVAKTTTVLNLGARLASRGKRVGLIDLDTQCNLTAFLMLGRVEVEEVDLPEPVPHPPAGQGGQRMPQDPLSAVPPNAFAPDVMLSDPFRPNIYTILNAYFAGGDPPPPEPEAIPVPGQDEEGSGRLYLIAGNPSLVKLEQVISGTMDVAPIYARYVGSLRRYMLKFAAQKDLDYILLDCGPNNGALNKVAVMSSDYILPPVFADFYSLSSVYGLLHTVLPDWLNWKDRLVQSQADLEEGSEVFRFKMPHPKLLPFLATKYQIVKQQNATHAKVIYEDSKWIRALRQLVFQGTVPLAVQHIFQRNADRMVIAFLKNLHAMNTLCQTLKRPHVWLSPQDTANRGGTYIVNFNNRHADICRERFDGLITFLDFLQLP